MKLDEYTTDQLVIELVARINATNSLEFCSEDHIWELIDLLVEVSDECTD